MLMQTLDINPVNDFISFSLHKRLRIIRVLHNKASDTSNSMYVIIKCNDGIVYELGISDHINHSHQSLLAPIVDNIIPRDILFDSMQRIGITVPDVNMLNGDRYYSILPCRAYTLDPKNLIGKRSSHLAFVSDCYQVRDARLLDDQQVLAIDYTSIDRRYHEEREYVNYNPIQAGCRSIDIAAIHYLESQMSIPEARYIYYHGLYWIQAIHDDYPVSLPDGHIFKMGSTSYLIRVLKRASSITIQL